ncbi:MAG: GNAT family N-acetyltransferase [Anaerolineae bacterium]
MSHVIIRHAEPDDALHLLAYLRVIAQERDNGIMMESVDDVRWTEDEERNIIREFAEKPNFAMFVAVDVEAGERAIVGQMGLHGSNRTPTYWTIGMGISIAKDYRNQGLGYHMMQTAIDWCREQPHVVRLELSVFDNNPRAIYLYEKVGFVHEGVQRYAAIKHGEYRHLHMMAYLFEDKLAQSLNNQH